MVQFAAALARAGYESGQTSQTALGGKLRQAAGATAAADATKVSPRAISLRCSDMSG
jgi:hypothetical protein